MPLDYGGEHGRFALQRQLKNAFGKNSTRDVWSTRARKNAF
jgi:hypothetical protein